nr:MAG: hypothetical protein [Microviridae sp.]
MKTSPTYIISDVFFDFGRFEPIFNDCCIFRTSVRRVHESLQGRSFSDYCSAVGFIRTTLGEMNCPFRFSLDYIVVDNPDCDGIECFPLKISVRVS